MDLVKESVKEFHTKTMRRKLKGQTAEEKKRQSEKRKRKRNQMSVGNG